MFAEAMFVAGEEAHAPSPSLTATAGHPPDPVLAAGGGSGASLVGLFGGMYDEGLSPAELERRWRRKRNQVIRLREQRRKKAGNPHSDCPALQDPEQRARCEAIEQALAPLVAERDQLYNAWQRSKAVPERPAPSQGGRGAGQGG